MNSAVHATFSYHSQSIIMPNFSSHDFRKFIIDSRQKNRFSQKHFRLTTHAIYLLSLKSTILMSKSILEAAMGETYIRQHENK